MPRTAYPLNSQIVVVYAADHTQEKNSKIRLVTLLDMKAKSSLGTLLGGATTKVLISQNKLVYSPKGDAAEQKVVDILTKDGKPSPAILELMLK